MFTLPETELLSISEVRGDGRKKTFIFEPLLPGYGVTLANALRRILLSSLAGAALTSVRIEGASHEFTTLPSVREDVLDIILNLKALRMKLIGEEPAVITLDVKGPAEVRAKDFSKNPAVEFADPEAYIATVEKGGRLALSATVERGRGFSPTELREQGKAPLGTIQLDASFSPVKKVSFSIENTRVGRMTNFDKVTMEITTDGTLDPAEALGQSATILVEHFGRLAQFARGEPMVAESIVPAKEGSPGRQEVSRPQKKDKPTLKRSKGAAKLSTKPGKKAVQKRKRSR